MLTCEICGEELLLEEDMKTHLLLRHLESDLHCPLCSLAGVSFSELSFHLLSAHPEEQDREGGPVQSTSHSGLTQSSCGLDVAQSACGSGAVQSISGSGLTQSTCGSGSAQSTFSSGLAQSTCGSGPSVRIKSEQNHTPRAGCLVSGGAPLFLEQSPEASAKCWKETLHEVDSDHSKGNLLQPFVHVLVQTGSTLRNHHCVFVGELLFSCPLCSLVCSSPFILQEHVELHLQDRPSDHGKVSGSCPLRGVIMKAQTAAVRRFHSSGHTVDVF